MYVLIVPKSKWLYRLQDYVAMCVSTGDTSEVQTLLPKNRSCRLWQHGLAGSVCQNLFHLVFQVATTCE